ncbi:MAG: hypothetical protein ACTSRI_02850 [Promethearchaeota archaeon]
MNKKFIEKEFSDYDKDLDEYTKFSIDKENMGWARFELLKDGHRVGKMYWDKIIIGYSFEEKPFLEIFTLNGFKLILYKNRFNIRPQEQMGDNCYIRGITPHFNIVEFYGEFDWSISLYELKIWK